MKKRFLLTALMLVVMLVASCASALADEDAPPPSQISENPNFSIYEWNRTIMPYASDELTITRTVASITKLSSTSIYVRGVTETNRQCSVVTVMLYVEQWKDNKWNSYASRTVSDFNSYTATATKVVDVEPGYYYRLVVQHRAIYGLEHVYDLTNTNSIYVN